MNTYSRFSTTSRGFALGRLTATARRRCAEAREMAYLYVKGVLTDTYAEEYRMKLRLLDRAIYSIYLDCIDAGAGEEASRLLDDLRQADLSVTVAA